MKYPDFLGENGVIGFVAPSFGCATEPYKTAFTNAIDKFKHMGFGVDLGPNCFVDLGIGISNTPQACAEELNSSYCSEKNDILISCGGGELMCEVIPYMDFERLKRAKPKWYMGYSDNTNFTFLATTICDTAAIYGPCAAAFGMEPWHESLEDALEYIKNGKFAKDKFLYIYDNDYNYYDPETGEIENTENDFGTISDRIIDLQNELKDYKQRRKLLMSDMENDSDVINDLDGEAAQEYGRQLGEIDEYIEEADNMEKTIEYAYLVYSDNYTGNRKQNGIYT